VKRPGSPPYPTTASMVVGFLIHREVQGLRLCPRVSIGEPVDLRFPYENHQWTHQAPKGPVPEPILGPNGDQGSTHRSIS
jgi:hypothetical protein